MNASLEDFSGHLYELAKDQNGCRFLQRKIEDTSQNNKQAITAIYEEIHGHFVELMTSKYPLGKDGYPVDNTVLITFHLYFIDSFGNYLCQKLLERCNNEQRNKIIEIVAPDIVNISLNMHGTRAVQKLIEFLLTPDQVSQYPVEWISHASTISLTHFLFLSYVDTYGHIRIESLCGTTNQGSERESCHPKVFAPTLGRTSPIHL
jgi:hypothetical protein